MQSKDALTNRNFKALFHQMKEKVVSLRSRWENSCGDDSNISEELRHAYKDVCRLCLENKSYERALEESKAALSLLEDEEVRVVNFLCLYNLKFYVLAQEALDKGLRLYPMSNIFKKYKFKMPAETDIPPQKNVVEEVRTKIPSAPVFPSTVAGNPGLVPNMQNLSMLENMREEDLQGMLGMMKNPMMKEQMKSMHGRDISDEELSRMEQMMTPQNLKMAMNMMKSNPDLLNNLGSKMNPGIGQGMASPFQRPVIQAPSQVGANFQSPNFPAPPLDITQSPFGSSPSPFGGDGMPAMPSASSLMENKGSIKMALGMFKENPKQILTMIAGMTNNPQLNSISQMSERKLQIIANCLYYLVLASLEIFGFVKKFKAQLLVLTIALFIYKFIL
jgi:hypothetical protein